MSTIPVPFNVLSSYHPSFKDIGNYIRNLPKEETCGYRLSYALNNAGLTIDKYDYPNSLTYGGKVRARNIDGANYIYSVIDMYVYLSKRYGDPENFKAKDAKYGEKYMTKCCSEQQGVIMFGFRHVDLWYGDNIVKDSGYDINYLWTNESITKRGIFFWDCQVQSDGGGEWAYA
jgi:hypothetical protein